MKKHPDTLPNDVEALKKMILGQQQQIDGQQRKILTLEETLRLERFNRFGASSEKAPGQGELFNEAEDCIDNVDDEPTDGDSITEQSSTPIDKVKPKRKPLPSNLPRVRKVYELAESELQCPCGCTLTEIGEEISEQLDVIPARFQVIQHARKKYACKSCEDTIKTAEKPQKILPKSNASAGTLAYVITAKYQDGLPLHRLSNIFKRFDVDLSRQTLSDWTLKTAVQCVPVIEALQKQLNAGAVVHCDETTVQVLKEPDKAAQSKSYMWVQKGGPPGKPVVRFSYDRGRSGQVPLRLLKGYQGALMTDGYTGYNAVAEQDGIVHLCCMAHLRRKFVDAQKSADKKGKTQRTSKADVAVNYIAKLYAVEKAHKDSDSVTRQVVRQEKSVLILKEFRKWIDKTQPKVLPKSKLGEALSYAEKYWDKATRYVENGDWPIDNNPAENAIRPFVIGRKNWLFSNTVSGANASATLYSLIETAKLNMHEPYNYLRWLFNELPKMIDGDAEHLMPWNIAPSAIKPN